MSAEAPAADPIALGIHEVEGWSHPVVAGAFPTDRNSTVLGSD